MEGNKSRKTYLDILRIIAIFFVLYAHTDRFAIHHYLVEGSAASFWVSLILQQITPINTAVFFAISGILLLKKEESVKELFRHRILRYIIIIIIFDFIQYCYNYHNNPEIGFDIGIILKRMYATTMITQYWYLYTYLAFLLILPYLRVLIKNMSEKMAKYLIGGFIVINGILPLVEILWENDRLAVSIPLFVNIIIYPFLGYYLEYEWYEKLVAKKRLIVSNVILVAALLLNVWYSYCRMQQGSYYICADGLVMIQVAVLYLDVRFIYDCIVRKKNKKANGESSQGVFSKILQVCGTGTFMIYLLEPQLREGYQFIYDNLYLVIGWLPATVLWLLAAMVTGIIISFVLRLIPFVRKFI